MYVEYASTLHNDKGAVFDYLFREYTKHSVNVIHHPELLKYWNLNLDKVSYEKKEDDSVEKLSLKKQINQHISDKFWPSSIVDKTLWFSSRV